MKTRIAGTACAVLLMVLMAAGVLPLSGQQEQIRTQEAKVNVLQLASRYEARADLLMREFHQNPRLRYQTRDTYDRILREVRAAMANNRSGAEVVIHDKFRERGGVWVDFVVERSKAKFRIVRGDVDALPVEEDTGLPYASTYQTEVTGDKQVPVMHACGHDYHTAALLTVLQALAEGAVQVQHNLRFVFDDAEENPGEPPVPESGLELLVRGGVTKDVEYALGFHIMAIHPRGVFCSRPGAVLGNSGRFFFEFTCKGGHIGHLETGVDGLRIWKAIDARIEQFGAQKLAGEKYSLRATIVRAGESGNILANKVYCGYGFRTLRPRDEHNRFMDDLERLVRAGVETRGGKVTEFRKVYGHPATVNNLRLYRQTMELFERNGLQVQKIEPDLGGESFSHLGLGSTEFAGVPSLLVWVGARQEGSGDHHSRTFRPANVLREMIAGWFALVSQ